MDRVREARALIVSFVSGVYPACRYRKYLRDGRWNSAVDRLHTRSQGALGAMPPTKNPRLTEHQRPNRMDKRELNDICGHKTRSGGS